MKGFIWGLIIGGALAFLAGMNVGKGKPILSNPFAERTLMQEIKDTANRAAEEAKKSMQKAGDEATRAAKEASKQIQESTGAAMDKAREAMHDATKPAPEPKQ